MNALCRIKQTTQKLHKHVDGVWTEAEVTAKKVNFLIKYYFLLFVIQKEAFVRFCFPDMLVVFNTHTLKVFPFILLPFIQFKFKIAKKSSQKVEKSSEVLKSSQVFSLHASLHKFRQILRSCRIDRSR